MKDWLTPNWPAPENVQALTTLRTTDQSYLQQLPKNPVWLKQVHGNQVVLAESIQGEKPEADASISFKPQTVCAVLTADCLPILLCDQNGTQVAALHAGWRSLASGVITNATMQFTASMSRCIAWLGPAIGPQAFEVGVDVLDGFLAHGWNELDIKVGFKPKINSENKWLGDLYSLARIALQKSGILAENIYGGGLCTYSDPDRFYSYRRSKDTGRMVSLIWLK